MFSQNTTVTYGTAVLHFRTVQCNEVHSISVQCDAIQFNAIQCNVPQCNTSVTQCIIMQGSLIQCIISQCIISQCSVIQFNTVSTVQYSEKQYNTVEDSDTFPRSLSLASHRHLPYLTLYCLGEAKPEKNLLIVGYCPKEGGWVSNPNKKCFRHFVLLGIGIQNL